MNYFKSLLALVVIFGLTGCFMERPTIKRGYNVVYSQLDFNYFDQDGGMSDRILPSGKQELSSGYNTAYFVPTTQQNYSLGKVSILMKEKVGRDFEINFGFKVINGADLKLVLNYLPQSDAKRVSTDDKGVDEIYINMQSVFSTNILPFAKQVIMDDIDGESLYAVNTEQLAKLIKQKLYGILSNVIIRERVVGANGNIVLSGNTISIVDVIDINNINIVPGEMPEVVQTEVQQLTDLQSELKAAKEDLKIEKDIKSKEMLDSAENVKAENDTLIELLEDPRFVQYQKMQQLKGIVEPKYDVNGEKIHTETKTQIIFYQTGMTAEQSADFIRSVNKN